MDNISERRRKGTISRTKETRMNKRALNEYHALGEMIS